MALGLVLIEGTTIFLILDVLGLGGKCRGEKACSGIALLSATDTTGEVGCCPVPAQDSRKTADKEVTMDPGNS